MNVKDFPNYQIIKISTICQSRWNHLGFTDLVQLNSGKLLIVFRKGKAHVDPKGKIIGVFGDQSGENWSKPKVLFSDKKYDSRDPSLTKLKDGRLMLSFFKFRFNKSKKAKVPNIAHTFLMVSEDEGRHFSQAIQIDNGEMVHSRKELEKIDNRWFLKSGDKRTLLPFKASSSAIQELEEDHLLIPLYGQSPGLFGPLSYGLSLDGGMTWQINDISPGEIDDLEPNEATILPFSKDHWLLQTRTQKKPGYLFQSVTKDCGKSWTNFRSLGLTAHSPELKLLSNGSLISVFRLIEMKNNEIDRVKMALIQSHDQGTTWSKPLVIEDFGKTETGYPGIVELTNGKLAISYYHVKKSKSEIKLAILKETR